MRSTVGLVRRATQAFGGLDLLINNAAFQKSYASIEEITAEELERDLPDQHLRDVLPVQGGAAEDARGRRDQRRLIQASQPSATLLAYAATKGAIVTFTKGLAQEAIKRGIRVNAVAPGPVWSR